jgi:hypothetical protein
MSERATSASTPSNRPQKLAWIYFAGAAIFLALLSLAIVVGNVAAGVHPQADENAWAHLFQLAMAAQLPLLLVFLATADWAHRGRVIILLGAQILAVGAAFAALAWSGY